MRKLIIALVALAVLGCDRDDAHVAEEAVANERTNALRVYLADSEYRRGYMDAMRDSVTWPSEAAR